MPDKDYKVGGTFYILADLSDLLGQPIPEAAKAALGDEKTIMETDVDIVYSLLFDKKIMIAPASNFGISAEKGYVRITCSGGNEQLNELLNRIECALQEARLNKYLKFKEQLATVYNKFQQTPYSCKEESSSLHNEINILFSKQQHPELTASELKEKCKKIQQLTIKLKANLAVPEDKNRATCKIQFFFRKHRGKKTINALKEADSKLFFSWLKKEFQPEVIPVFANYNVVERREKFCFYRKHLKALAGENIISDLNNNVLQTDIKMQQK
jgi:aspartate aminotransferase/aminotransferase